MQGFFPRYLANFCKNRIAVRRVFFPFFSRLFLREDMRGAGI